MNIKNSENQNSEEVYGIYMYCSLTYCLYTSAASEVSKNKRNSTLIRVSKNMEISTYLKIHLFLGPNRL